MKQYVDQSPLNASIIVDYESDQVKFDYPIKGKRQSVWMIANSLIVPYTFIYILVLLIMVGAGQAEFISTEIKTISVLLWSLSYLLAVLLVYYRYSFFSTVFPKWNAWMLTRFPGRRKFIRVNDLKFNVYEVSVFKNVYLNYEAFEDYSKQLIRVEVLPHPFKYLDDKGKEHAHDSFWLARFYFKAVPVKGELRIEYL